MKPIIIQNQRNLKDISQSLDILNHLHKDHYVVVEKPNTPIDKIFAKLKKDANKGFSLEFEEHNYPIGFADIDHLDISTQKHKLHINRVFINTIAPPIISGKISDFTTLDFNKKTNYFYRLIIPLQKKFNFIFYISHFYYETKKTKSSECLRISYDKLEIDVYLHHGNGKQFLIIDTSTKLSHDLFSDYCFSTLVSLGYVTGTLPQDEGYYFAYEKSDLKTPKHIYYTEFRDSMYSVYHPIHSNAHAYIRDKDLAKKTHTSLRTLSLKEFSMLCQWTYSSTEFASILFLIIESSISTLLVMPSGFSVALEGLTDIIVKINEDKVAPIKDKILAKKIKEELIKVVESYSINLEKAGKQILKNKIENINQLTNRSKLSKPFELLKFTLTPEDIKAIEHRNDFLHGRITLMLGDNTEEATKEIYYIALRLYTLLAVLILKSIGYDNKIVNYPKIHEVVYSKKLDELHFRQI